MPDHRFDHPLFEALARPRNLMILGGGVVVVGVVAAILALTLALAGRGAPPVAVSGGTGLTVAVVAPVEPDVQPGSRMEVGALSDGFDGHMPQTAATPGLDDYQADPPGYVEDDYADDPPRKPPVEPAPTRYSQDRPSDDEPARPVQDEYRGDPRAFGFDIRRPDYQAEREARRAAAEARIEAERRNPSRHYSSAGPGNDPAAEFY